MRRAFRDRAPFRRRLNLVELKLRRRDLIDCSELVETRYDLCILDDRAPDREELIELLERRFPWFAISLHDPATSHSTSQQGPFRGVTPT